MLWVGIDTHLEVHEVAIINEKSDRIWSGRIGNNRSGFTDLIRKLRTVEESRNDSITGIYMNPTANYHMPVASFLRNSRYNVYEINPMLSKSIRDAVNMGKNKSDIVDAMCLASTPLYNSTLRNHERLNTSNLTRYRQKIVNEMTKFINILRCDLVATFPEIMSLLDVRKRSTMKLLEHFPDPREYSKNRDAVLKTLAEYGRGHIKPEKLNMLMEMASTTIGIEDSVGFYAMRISETAGILLKLMDTLGRVDERIEMEMEENEDVENIDDIRGMDISTAAAIVSEIGNIKQFDSAEKLQSYGGKAPSQSSSAGQMRGSWSSKVSNPYLSSTVSIAARSLVWSRSTEFFAIYERELAKGKTKKMAYMVVGKRLLHHVFSIMKNHKPYLERLPHKMGGNIHL